MASILRSSKFVRYIAGFARNIVVNPPREFDGSFVNTTQCLCGAVSRSLTSQISATQHDQGLEYSLRRIDQDVRKSGRISRRDIEDVLEEIRSTKSATSSQSLLVIRCCGNLVPEELPEIRTKLVQEIWSTLNKLHIPMDISHYNALLRVYLENEHQFSPTEFLADLEAKGIEPNRVTYQRLIARYCQVGDIEGATKILEFMREKQLPVNENVFNALIFGHSQAGDMDSAKGILNVMTQAGLEPTADTYTTLLCGYAKNSGDIEAINRLFEECETKDIYLLDKDYLDVVYALATNNHQQQIPVVLNKVRKAVGYNQDAINLILRLINKGEEDSAFVVLQSMIRPTRSDGTLVPTGNFFVKHLVKANRPAEKIIDICNKLETNNMYDRALLLATETSLQLGNDKLAYHLLEELQKRNIEIRQHFFWPLIISKANNDRGIIEVLQQMQTFGILPNIETLREYVIPNLKGNSGQILAQLRDANISVGVAASCIVHSLLQKNDLEEAAIISSRVNAYYNPDLLKRPLTSAFYKTKDLNSYITLIRNIYENLNRRSVLRDEQQQTQEPIDKADVIGNILYELTTNNREFLENIENILTELINQGLSISTKSAERLQEKFGEKMTEQISSLLGRLTSGELTPIPLIKKPPTYTPSHQMNIPQLERLIENLEAKKQDVKGLKRQLLTLYYRAKDLEKTEILLKDLENCHFNYSPGIYAQLADLYAYHENLEKSLYYYEKLKELQQDEFTLDESKTIIIAQLLVKNNRFDDAIKLLENTPRDTRVEERNFNYSALVWRFLNSLAEEGRVEDLDRLFDTLIKKDFIEVNNVLLGPLIKVQLVRNDIDKALEKFEWCVNQFKATPWKSDLACKLIQSEDADKLQKLTDLSTSVHGEINSLYDLVFAFVECGRIRQARKILETPGLQNRPQRINTVCERYQQEGLIKPLEGLKDATKDLNHIDRTDIYYQLLLSYIKQDDVDKALGLWTQMQEEDLAPTDDFLKILGNYLESRGMNVPFIIPQTPTSTTSGINESVKTPTQQFRQKLKNNEIDKALTIYETFANNLTVTDVSLLIERLVQTERLSEATRIARQLLDRKLTPINRVFKYFLNKLAANGDVENLTIIGTKINQETKKLVSFDNRLCHANLIAGKAEQYLNQLEQELVNAKDDDLQLIAEKFPRGGAYGILERHPELIDKYENLAIKYGEKGIVAPLNVLWTNYFITNNDTKAEEIWEKYLKDSPRIMFQRIVHTARDNRNEQLIKKLINHLKISNVTEGAIGNAYSCLLDVLVVKDNQDEIVEAFETAVKEVGLSYLNRTAILRVKEIYDRLGKPFDYAVPPKNVKNQVHTSSTSEDDVKRS